MGAVKDDVMMVEIKHERDVEFLANGEEVVDAPADIIVFQHQTRLNGR
jgi:hypothetical protein